MSDKKDKKKDKDKKDKDKKGDKDKKDKKDKPKDHGGAAPAGSVIPTQYHSQKVNYQYPVPKQDPRQPFIPPNGLDEITRALFISSSLAFRSVDLDHNGDLSPGEFKEAMKKLNYFVPKPAGAPAKEGKKDKKDKKGKKEAKGLWSDLFKAIDRDGGGSIDEREFCEYYVWAQKQGYGHAATGSAGGAGGAGGSGHYQPGTHSMAHGAAYLGMGAPTVQFQWNKVDGALAKIAAAGNNIWGVNAEGNIWRMGPQGWAQVAGSAASISVGSDGTCWVVTPSDEIYRRNGENWEQVPGALSSVSVAAPNNVWGCNKANEIYNWNGSQWNKVDGVAKVISVGDDGCVWAINPAGEIWRRAGVQGGWERVPGTLASVSVRNANSVVGVNAANEIWVWTGQGWTQAPGLAKDIAVGANLNHSVWAVTPTGEIYRHVQ